jgi:hypothetical protein
MRSNVSVTDGSSSTIRMVRVSVAVDTALLDVFLGDSGLIVALEVIYRAN